LALFFRDRASGKCSRIDRGRQFKAGEEGSAAINRQPRAGAQRHNHERELHGEGAPAVLCELLQRTEHDPFPCIGARNERAPSKIHQLSR
jgi:hypothetical protein